MVDILASACQENSLFSGGVEEEVTPPPPPPEDYSPPSSVCSDDGNNSDSSQSSTSSSDEEEEEENNASEEEIDPVQENNNLMNDLPIHPSSPIPNPTHQPSSPSYQPNSPNHQLPENEDLGVQEANLVYRTLPEGIFPSTSKQFRPSEKARVVNEEIARLEFLRNDLATGRPEGLFLVSSGLIYSTLYFTHRTVGELVVIDPTEAGLGTPEFMTLFNSFALYEESESERTRRQRAHTYV